MHIDQLSASPPPPRLHDQVPAKGRIAQVEHVAHAQEPWNEAVFVRAYDGFAAQLGRQPFEAGSAKLNELAVVYERSSATTLEAFAGQVLTTHSA